MLAETPATDGLVKDTTTAAFRQDVIQESSKQPVLVDFAPLVRPVQRSRGDREAVRAAGAR